MLPRIQFLVCFLLFSALSQFALAASNPDELKPKQREAIEAAGSILKPDDVIGHESYLRELADILAPHQIKIINSRADKERVEQVKNEIYFVDSPSENAFVLTGRGMLVKGVLTNRVVLATGLIKFLHERAGGNRDIYAFYLMGVLAHEMAHPIEVSQETSLSKGWKQGQAGEVLADYDGAYLLREAGFPEEAVYEALKVVLHFEEKPEAANTDEEMPKEALVLKTTFKAAASSHPETGVRLSLQRIGLTLSRRLFGVRAAEEWLPQGPRLQSEAIRIAGGEIKIEKLDLGLQSLPLGTLEEVQKALDEYLANGSKDDLQFNHLILVLAERVAAQTGAPDPAFIKWMVNFLTELIDNDRLYIQYVQFHEPSRRHVSFLRPEQKAFQDVHPKRFRELNTESEWLNHPNFIEAFRREFLKIYGSDFLEMPIEKQEAYSEAGHLFFHSNGLNGKVGSVFNSAYWFRIFKHEWLATFEVLLDKYVEVRGQEPPPSDFSTSGKRPLKDIDTIEKSLREILEGFPPEDRFALIELIEKRPQAEQVLFDFFIEQTSNNNLDPFVVSRLIYEKDEDKAAVRDFAKNHPEALEDYLRLHSQYKNMLLFGDVYMSFELRSDFSEHYVDWEMLAEFRGEKLDSKQLGRDFSEFAKSGDYAAWIEASLPALSRISGPYKKSVHDGVIEDLTREYSDAAFRPKWWSPNLAEDLLGLNNPKLKAKKKLFDQWKAFAMPRLAGLDPAAFGRLSKEALIDKLQRGTRPDFKSWVTKLYDFAPKEMEQSFNGGNEPLNLENLETFRDVIARSAVWYLDALKQSEINIESQKALAAYFGEWSVWLRSRYADKIWARLYELGIVKTPSEFLKNNRASVTAIGEKWHEKQKLSYAPRIYFRWGDLLSKELAETQNYQKLSKFIEAVFGLDEDNEVSMTSAYAKILDESIAALSRVEMKPDQRIKLYQKITASGGTLVSDRFLLNTLMPDIRDSSLRPSQLERMTKNARSQQAKLALARIYFESLGFEKFENLTSSAGIQRFLKTLDSLVPGKSLERDNYIEELAWSRHVDDLELLQMLEDAKSTGNRRSTSPHVVSLASAVSKLFENIPPDERWDIVEYLSSAVELDIPESVGLRIEKSLGPKEGEEATFGQRSNIAEAKLKTFNTLETLKRLSWPEKIPALEFLLTTGTSPLAREALPTDERFLKVLNLQKDSPIAVALDDYVEIIPKHEITVTAAYLLARNSENLDLSSGKLKDIFELFQVVGKKIGQGAHTWGLVEHSEDLRDLKDRSSPMSKFEIVSGAHKYFGEENAAKIESYDRIVASGSIKTVTRVTLKDGRTAALETRSEYAERQVRATLMLAYKYVEKLQQRGLVPSGPFVSNLMSRLAVQLTRELNFTNEAKALPIAKKVFDQVQAEMGSELRGYRINVPQTIEGFPVAARAMMVEFAPGEAVDRLPEALQTEVGPLLLKVYARALLRLGWIDADRSVANQLVDANERTISILDLGQATQLETNRSGMLSAFKGDDRTRVLGLVGALNDGDPDEMLTAVGVLLTPTSKQLWDATKRMQVRRELQANLTSGSHIEERLIALISALENNGLHMEERFSVYTMKGMLTLLAEPYADKPTQRSILSAASNELLKEKKAHFVLQGIKTSCARLLKAN